jgi:hypothetical protein
MSGCRDLRACRPAGIAVAGTGTAGRARAVTIHGQDALGRNASPRSTKTIAMAAARHGCFHLTTH